MYSVNDSAIFKVLLDALYSIYLFKVSHTSLFSPGLFMPIVT
jgi:hypothetical protein